MVGVPRANRNEAIVSEHSKVKIHREMSDISTRNVLVTPCIMS